MPEIPTFFFSHARQDTETPGNYLKSFFADLEIKLAQWAGVSRENTTIGIIDVRTTQGHDWDKKLSKALAESKAFVAVLTPLYFNRPNCGKELGAFLLRHRALGLTQDGALSGVTNVLPIRWLPDEAYASNAVKNARIPALLRNIEDTPAEDLQDPDRTQAIQRYRKKGMEKCVKVEPHYGELLDAIVTTLRDMGPLPTGTPTLFPDAPDAFTYDWKQRFGAAQNVVAGNAPALIPRLKPQPLSDVVVTYVTDLQFTPEPGSVDFAEALIAEPLPGQAAAMDAFLQTLMSDVGKAAANEGFHVYHASASPGVSPQMQPLVSRLVSLTKSKIVSTLVVDADIWPLRPAPWIDEVIASPDWVGPVLISGRNAQLVDFGAINGGQPLRRQVVVLPANSPARLAILLRTLVFARGDLFVATEPSAPAAEALPLLKNTGTAPA